MFTTTPIDAVSQTGEWLASYRYEPFLKRWFLADPQLPARVVLLNTDQLPPLVLAAAERDGDPWLQACYRAPLKVQIQLNRYCNYACPMCYASSTKRQTSVEEWPVEDLDELFRYLKDWGVLRVNFVGGEIFMRRDIEAIIDLALSHRLLVSCITNARIPGTSIERFAPLLARLWNVQVSCNGVGKSYEQEYGTESWERSRVAIGNVLSATRANILSYVITDANVNDIPTFLDFAAETKPTIVKFGTVCWSGRSSGHAALQYYRVTLPQAQVLITEGRERYPFLQIQSQLDAGADTPLWEEFTHGYRPFEFYFAPEARDGVYISSSGEVFPFPLLSDRAPLCVGNYKHHDLREIWEESPTLKEIRAVTFANSDCGKIGCRKVCGLWGRSYAISWSGRFDGKVPCHLTGWEDLAADVLAGTAS